MPSHLDPETGFVALDPESEADPRDPRAIADCGLCDDDGYRGALVCDHVDRSETAQRGLELIRAELAKIAARKAGK